MLIALPVSYTHLNGGTKFFDLEGQKEETVADGAMMTVTPGSQKALFYKDNITVLTESKWLIGRPTAEGR